MVQKTNICICIMSFDHANETETHRPINNNKSIGSNPKGYGEPMGRTGFAPLGIFKRCRAYLVTAIALIIFK